MDTFLVIKLKVDSSLTLKRSLKSLLSQIRDCGLLDFLESDDYETRS